MRFAELDAVTVDGFGTLVELDDPVPRLVQALGGRGFARSPSEVAAAFEAEAAHYRLHAHAARDEATLAALRDECVDIFLRELAVPLEPREFVDGFLAALVFRPVAGALEALGSMRSRGLKLAVVSNWDCSLPERLGELGLLERFEAIVTSAEAGAPKPEPGAFALALERLGVTADRALHVGDEESDERGAHAAGMHFAPAPLSTAGGRAHVTARLVAWLAFVGAFIAVAYVGRASTGKPDEDVLYRYDTAVGILIQSVIVLAIVLWITRGPMQRDLLGLRAPRSWSGAVGWSIALVVAILVVIPILESRLHGGEEQGLAPDGWDPDRARQYLVNAVLIAGVTPVVEELMFRGAGYSLLARFGQVVAILVVGVTFGLVHGLVYGLAALTVFGIGLAWLRAKTESVYPCIVIHCLFNTVALVVAVTA